MITDYSTEQVDALELWALLAAQELHEFCDEAQEAAGNPDGTDQLPGTRALRVLEAAQNALDEYENLRIAQIKKRLDKQYQKSQPRPSDLAEAEREFQADPIRQQLIKSLCNVKLLVERPRFMVTPT